MAHGIRQGVWPALGRVALYTAAVASPLAVAAFGDWGPQDNYVVWIGEGVALAAFAILAMQFTLSARLRWIEAPFGLDRVLRFHRVMAVAAAALLVCHPLLVAPAGTWRFLTSLEQPWYVLAGKAALLLIALNVAVSLWVRALRLKYEPWHLMHNVFAALTLAGGFIHGWMVGPDLEPWPMRALWVALAAVAMTGYAWNRLLRPWRLRRRAWTVAEVLPETPSTWTLRLKPPQGAAVPDYLPGQFHFLKLHRGRGLPGQEHPFTISSSPTEGGLLASTIKEAGDFTSTIGGTRPGDRCSVLGPYGRFSYLLHPDEKDLVFIAGGIGITPFASMLRHMHDTGADLSVRLFYANRKESDIAFRKPLDKIAAAGQPHLRVVHVLSQADDGWRGERGYVDEAFLRRHLGPGAVGKAYYLCGPPPMMKLVRRALRRMGVPARHIRFERFRL